MRGVFGSFREGSSDRVESDCVWATFPEIVATPLSPEIMDILTRLAFYSFELQQFRVKQTEAAPPRDPDGDSWSTFNS